MPDERDELLEEIERRLYRITKAWASDGCLGLEVDGEAAPRGMADVLRLIDKARALGVVRYPRP